MTSPLQQKIKITGPSMVTANRTSDGIVIYRTAQQSWSASLSDAAIVRTSDEARALLNEANADVRINFLECWEWDGDKVQHFSWVTDLRLSQLRGCLLNSYPLA